MTLKVRNFANVQAHDHEYRFHKMINRFTDEGHNRTSFQWNKFCSFLKNHKIHDIYGSQKELPMVDFT